MSRRLRVAICDDHAILRAGLRRITEDDPGIEVVGETATADDAVALARAESPDVFLMDLTLAGEGGISATRRIAECRPRTRVLILTMHDDVAYLREAFEAGAAGFIVKKQADVDLLQAIRTVAAGQRYINPTLGAALLGDDPGGADGPSPISQLSPREAEILKEIALGYTNREIAERLVLSVRTVEGYRASVQEKLNMRSRADLTRFARDSGLLI